MFLRNISTSVQMILRCLGKERDAADVPTWNDNGRDGQEDLGLRQFHHHTTYENRRPGDDEAVEPAGGCVVPQPTCCWDSV